MVASGKIAKLLEHTPDLPPSMLVSATYDGDAGVAVLKFYEPKTQVIHLWYDDTGHKPYCFSKLPPDHLKDIKERSDVLDLRVEEKLDTLRDEKIEVIKIRAKDPLAIGGLPSERSIRNLIEAWEADIKYYENYLYDKGLIVGAFYEIKGSKVVPVEYEVPRAVEESLREILDRSNEDFKPYIIKWANLFNQPLPEIRRASLDIEVLTPEESRVPNPSEAQYPVVAVSMVGSDGVHEVLLLKKDGEELKERAIEKASLALFQKEEDLIAKVFERILDYPFTITYNGDEFDLNYLYHRALKLGFKKEEMPISLGKDVAFLKHGVHIDLYKFFINRSIQVYAFRNRYTEHTLNGVCKGLLGKSKIEFEGPLASLPLYELAKYCYNDALLTHELTSDVEDVLLKLIVVISRVARMPMDDVARMGVSNWIRSMIYFEHRRINALIPKREELEAKGGATTEAIIKGKKYRGANVVEPEPGIHFNVSVLDFASLYPSIIKVHNLSYETVRCGHPECRSNIIPETDHWVCKRRHGIASLVIGSLRDLRVNYYKPLTKSQHLSPTDRSLYEVVAQALKVILNASYGVMGAEIFPLYCLPVAEATASIGRYAINRTIEKCREFGIRVVYSDTDSLFLESPSEEQISAISAWSEKELGIELDSDKVYRYVAFSARKKNYLGVLTDGSVDVKGLTGKKSHVPPFIKSAFDDTVSILSRVKSPEDFERAREEIRGELKRWYLKLKRREIGLEDLAFNVMIGKPPEKYVDTTPQHVKAAQLLIKGGKEVRAGDIISYIKTLTPPGVKPISLAKVDDVDTEKYLEYLRSTFDQLLDALGYQFDEILGATKLEDFFWS